MRFAIALYVALLTASCTRESESARSRAQAPVAAACEVRVDRAETIADVAQRVTPSVVNVFSARSVRALKSRAVSLGSGVIVAPDGIIVTNEHVIANAAAIAVVLADGRELEAKVIGTDAHSDIAVLRVDATGLPPIALADSSRLRVGQVVLAIGNPFGIGQTVTQGIVSALGRANMGINDVEDFVQTDAAVNPGNSGGALVDMNGRLVGMNTAIMSRTGGYQGISFAIPSNMVRQVADELLRHGKITRGWLGVVTEDTSDQVASRSHVAARSGVFVAEVSPEGPAARAGLVRGDVITSVDGVRIADSAHLRNVVSLAGTNRVRVELVRAGQRVARYVALVEAPASGHDLPLDDRDGDLLTEQ